MRRTLKWLAALLAAGFTGCAALPFSPSSSVDATPDALNLPYEELRIRTADGETLAGWYIPAGNSAGKAGAGKTLIFFHGNAGNMSHRLETIALFHRLGLSTLIIDYRGFGHSTGKPSVNGAITDAEASWDWLREWKNPPPGSVVLFGRSLGGGVAAALAARHEPGALILESTFTSLHDVAKDMFPLLPVGLFLPQDFDTPGNIEKLRIPLLVVHSPDDEVVPYRLGKALYDEYAGPKRLLVLSGTHNSGFRDNMALYEKGLADFLRALPRGGGEERAEE